MNQQVPKSTSLFILISMMGIPIASMFKPDFPLSMHLFFGLLVLIVVTKYLFLLGKYMGIRHPKAPTRDEEVTGADAVTQQCSLSLQKDEVELVVVLEDPKELITQTHPQAKR